MIRGAHCVKIVCIRSFSGPYFSALKLNIERYGVEKLIIRTLFTQWHPRLSQKSKIESFAIIVNSFYLLSLLRINLYLLSMAGTHPWVIAISTVITTNFKAISNTVLTWMAFRNEFWVTNAAIYWLFVTIIYLAKPMWLNKVLPEQIQCIIFVKLVIKVANCLFSLGHERLNLINFVSNFEKRIYARKLRFSLPSIFAFDFYLIFESGLQLLN